MMNVRIVETMTWMYFPSLTTGSTLAFSEVTSEERLLNSENKELESFPTLGS